MQADDIKLCKTRRYSEEEVRSFSTIHQYMRNLGRLPMWILGWFGLTAVVCSWDASFILLRPLSFPDAVFGALWMPYKMYISVDQRYLDVNDGFVVAISLLNFAEVVFNVITIYLHVTKNKHTVRVGFTVSVMTFWKTVLYLLMFLDVCGGTKYRVHNTLIQEIFIYVLPNIMWVCIPGIVMVALWNRLMPPLPSPEIVFTLHCNGTTNSSKEISVDDNNNNNTEYYMYKSLSGDESVEKYIFTVCNDVTRKAFSQTATSRRSSRYLNKSL